MSDFKTYEETVSEILARWSVQDLVEQTNTDLAKGDERFYKSSTEMNVIAKGKHALIDWWKIESDGKFYECRRFKNFAWCSCKSFFFSKKICKHLALSCGPECINCHESRATNDKLCFDCHTNKMRFTPRERVAA